MTKFMHLGLSADQVIEKVTAAPARSLTFPERIGSLETGAPADVTILRVRREDIELRDSLRETRVAHQRLVHVATIKAGVPL